MKRRDFLKQTSMAALAAASVARVGAASKRIAFGGIQIECSTYGNILSRMEDFTVRRGQELADYRAVRHDEELPSPVHAGASWRAPCRAGRWSGRPTTR